MKTLADFKRALSLGSVWEGWHLQSGTSLGVREVCKVMYDGVRFKLADGRESTMDFPKATGIRFDDEGYVYLKRQSDHMEILKYKLVK